MMYLSINLMHQKCIKYMISITLLFFYNNYVLQEMIKNDSAVNIK